jgi:hypothetical protein
MLPLASYAKLLPAPAWLTWYVFVRALPLESVALT